MELIKVSFSSMCPKTPSDGIDYEADFYSARPLEEHWKNKRDHLYGCQDHIKLLAEVHDKH